MIKEILYAHRICMQITPQKIQTPIITYKKKRESVSGFFRRKKNGLEKFGHIWTRYCPTSMELLFFLLPFQPCWKIYWLEPVTMPLETTVEVPSVS